MSDPSEDGPEPVDRSGNRLAWATDDAAFLAQRELGGSGAQHLRLWVALPAGRAVATIDVGDTSVRLG